MDFNRERRGPVLIAAVMLIAAVSVSAGSAGCTSSSSSSRAEAEPAPHAAGIPDSTVRLTAEGWDEIKRVIDEENSGAIPFPFHTADAMYPDEVTPADTISSIRVGVVVDAEGRVTDAVVMGPDVPPALEKAALEAAYQYEFHPGRRDGEPVRSATVINVGFKPEEPAAFQAFDEPPVLIRYVPPSYPDADRKAGIEGTVLLRVLVSVDGKVTAATIIQSDVTPEMEKAAIAAIRMFLFKPAKNDGIPVESTMAVPLRFKIHGS